MSADMYVVVPIWRGCWVWNHGVCRGCREYVTEPVDVMLVVTGRGAVCSGWAAVCMYRCDYGGGLWWGVHYHL